MIYHVFPGNLLELTRIMHAASECTIYSAFSPSIPEHPRASQRCLFAINPPRRISFHPLFFPPDSSSTGVLLHLFDGVQVKELAKFQHHLAKTSFYMSSIHTPMHVPVSSVASAKQAPTSAAIVDIELEDIQQFFHRRPSGSESLRVQMKSATITLLD